MSEAKRSSAPAEQHGASSGHAQQMIDGLMEGCQVIGRDFRYLYVNDAVVEQARVPRERLEGRTMMEAFPGIENTEMFSVLERCMSERTPQRMENEFTFPDGSTGWFELRFQAVPDGVAILSLDVTARKLVDAELQRSKRALAVLSACNQALLRATSESELLRSVCDIAVNRGGYRLAWIGFKTDGEAREVHPVAVTGAGKEYAACLRIRWDDSPEGQGPTGSAIRTGEPITARRTGSAVDVARWRDEDVERDCASCVALPFTVNGSVVGALNICASEPDAFDEAERALLEELAGDLGYGIETHRARVRQREVEARYRALYENSLDALLLTAPDGRTLAANPAACRLFDRTEAELCRIGRAGVVAADDLRLGELIKQRDKTGQVLGGLTLLRRDGTRFEAEISSSVFETSEGPRGSMVIRDVSDRLRAEKRRAQSEARFRALFEQAADGVVVLELQASAPPIVDDANDAACELFGHARAELIGKSVLDLDADARAEGKVESRRQAIVRGETVRFETRSRRKDGSTVDVECSIRGYRSDGKWFAFTLIRDVTARKQAEQALRSNEARMRSLLANLPQRIFIKDLHSVYRFCNENFARDLGIPPDEIVGKDDFSLFPKEVAERYRADDRSTLETGGPSVLEEPYPEAGHRRWVRTVKVPYDEGSGEVSGVLGIFEDITERRATEEALRTSEQKFSSLFEMLPFPTTLAKAPRGVIVEVNRAFEEGFGYSKNEAIGKTSVELGIHPDPSERVSQMAEAREKGSVRGKEVTLSTRGAGPRVFLVDGKVLEIDGELHSIQTAQDITDRKKAEQALRESEERYRRLTENLPDLVWRADADGNILFVNRTIERLLGYTPDEVMQTSMMKFLSADSLAHVTELLEVARADPSQIPHVLIEIECIHKDGSLVSGELHAVPVVDDEGRLCAVEGVTRDIRTRKAAEHERDELQAQLDIARRLESVGRLAGGVAHDFNNLLTVILSYAVFAAEELRPSDPLRADIEAIRQAGERATRLTRQLLAFSRKQVLEPRVLDLNQAVRDIEGMLRRLLGEDIAIETHLDEAKGNVMADPGQVEQVIMNLAVNARDAMPNGGTLTIKTAYVELGADYVAQHAGSVPGQFTMLTMSDTGVGMTPETKARVFEPFFTTKAKAKGTGLGLSTVYGIVKQSGGNIWVDSEPGRGTTFEVYLPHVDAPAAEAGERSSAATATGTETVLIVEDEDDLRTVAARILRNAGYNTLTASTGGDALLLCESHGATIDLLLTDVVMPLMSGRELAERLAPIVPGLKVLYMSGYPDDAIDHHGVLAPGTRFIAKPFEAAELARKVRQALDES